MYLTQNEILSQYEALKKTYEYLSNKEDEIKSFLKNCYFKKIVYIGCGSSYLLCKSAQLSTSLRLDIPVFAIPAGDLLVNFDNYKDILKNALIVAPSRSGSTSEVLMAFEKAKTVDGTKFVAVTAKEDTELSKISDLSIDLPWAFDESVCQTRTVTNLYTADLLFIAFLSNDNLLVEEIGKAINIGNDFINKTKTALSENEIFDFQKVVVLADGELAGIASEGALAFNEISEVPSNYYHLLDVRHGPMVLINKDTLVIAINTSDEINLINDLLKDIKGKGAYIILSGPRMNNGLPYDVFIEMDNYTNTAVYGIPFILIPQLISLNKAIIKGTNPDKPTGLDPWIKLQ